MSRIDAVSEVSERGNATMQGTRTGASNNSPEELVAAERYVVKHAKDEADADELLKMLGLRDPGFKWVETLSRQGSGHRRKVSEEEAA